MNPVLSTWSLADQTGTVAVTHLQLADRFWSRFAGLQFRRPLEPRCGLLIVPGGSVHTMWLRFSLDLAMLGDGGAVIAVRRNIRPWRVSIAPRRTRAVLEMTAGEMPFQPGDRVQLICNDTTVRFPSSVRFLVSAPKVGTHA